MNGNTDTSGMQGYNPGAVGARAEAVAAELVQNGAPKSGIATTASACTSAGADCAGRMRTAK
jgi:outer membrane protein OmpA-like peptidoglycan-associated protein